MNAEEDLALYGGLYRYLKYLNRLIFFVILTICINIIVSPYSPELAYAVNRSSKNENIESKLIMFQGINKVVNEEAILSANSNIEERNINTILIPSIDVDAEVKELSNIEDLHDGAWRRPETSTPDKGGNTVIIAHRYTRRADMSGPNTFYHLPKVKIGDKVYVHYKNILYTYEVYNIEVVDDSRVDIEDATTTANILTLYTCTPLWSAANRHVVYAKLISPDLTSNNTKEIEISNGDDYLKVE